MKRILELQMPCSNCIDILNPEAVVIKWPNKRSLHLGQICFINRDTSSRRRQKHIFDNNSLDINRTLAIPKLVRAFSEIQILNGLQPESMIRICREFMSFIKICDQQGISANLNDPLEAEDSLRIYMEHSRNSLNLKSTSAWNTESLRQKSVIKVFRQFFDDENWGTTLRPLKYDNSNISHTEVPSDYATGINTGTNLKVFSAITDHILNNNPYPIIIEELIGNNGLKTSITLHAFENNRRPSAGRWNEKTGEPLKYAEIAGALKGLYSRQKAYARSTGASNLLEQANKERSQARLAHASFAASCFSAVLLANTGINLENLINIDNEPEVSKTRQGYRALKLRAKGRVVFIEIQSRLMPALIQYLKLRRYMLGDELHDALLIVRDKNKKISRLPRNFLHLLHVRFQRLGIVNPAVTAREFRAKKQDYLIATGTASDTAELMQHSISTGDRSYTSGSKLTQQKELGQLFRSLPGQTVTTEERVSIEVENSVGACKTPLNPIRIKDCDDDGKFLCHVEHGCLFCTKNKVHADEVDARKLLSAQLVLRQASITVSGTPVFENTYGKLLTRLEEIIFELRERIGEEIFIPLLREVEEEQRLHPFWEAKLDQLIFMGIV